LSNRDSVRRGGAAASLRETSLVGWAALGTVVLAAVVSAGLALTSLTGSALVGVPLGLVAGLALLGASFALGRDLAGRHPGPDDAPLADRLPRHLRRGALAAALVVTACASWFLAFWAYHGLVLDRGGDVEATATHAAQLAEVALAPLRRDVEARPQVSAGELRGHGPVADYLARIGEMARGRRPEAAALAQARQRELVDRQRLRADLARQRADVVARHGAVDIDIGAAERGLTAARQELAALPQRIVDLRSALSEEQDGTRPPGAPGAAPSSGDRPPVTAATGGALFLRPDGLAASLVREPACRAPRQPGQGPCHRALELALQAAGPRERELVRLIPQSEDAVSALRDEARGLPRRLARIDRQLTLYPALSPATTATGDELVRLTEARDAFERTLSEEAYIALADQCSPIAGALRALPAGERPAVLSSLECRSDAVETAVADREAEAAAARDFAGLCGSGPTSQRVAVIVARMRADLGDDGRGPSGSARRERRAEALDEVQRSVIDPCLAVARLAGVAPEPFAEEAAAFARRVSPRRGELSRATSATVQVLTLAAPVPIFVAAAGALAQTLALVVLALARTVDLRAVALPRRTVSARAPRSTQVDWTPREGDPPRVAGAKWLLAACRDQADGSALVVAGFAASAPPEVRTSAQTLLADLMRDGGADAATFGDTIRIAPDGIVRVERIVERHAEEIAAAAST
jgi:hypothetical protein